MKQSPVLGEDIDRVMLSWATIWSVALSVIVVLIIHLNVYELLDDGLQFALGAAMGGLAAAWTLVGTWVVIFHLPKEVHQTEASATPGQRMKPRVVLALMGLIHLGIFLWLVQDAPGVQAIVPLICVVGILFSLIAYQWRRQRIYRGVPHAKAQQGIRHILGMTTTIAVLIAILKLSSDWIGLSGVELAMVVSIAALGFSLMVTMLGRWWWMVLLTIPLAVVALVVIGVFLDLDARTSESVLIRFSGAMQGYYIIGVLLLALMRSSGHRWTVVKATAA